MRKNIHVLAAIVATLAVSCQEQPKDYISLLDDKENELRSSLSECRSQDEAETAYAGFMAEASALIEEGLSAHPDDSVAVALILKKDFYGITDAEELLADIDRLGPNAAADKKIQKLASLLKNKISVTTGTKFVDFSIRQTDGSVKKLSDYAGKGHYCVVDFWASWCEPCKQEIPYLKKALKTYGKKGLKIVSVAVWDDPKASADTAKAYGVNWPQILNAQSVPTELYGINGIPYIMLLSPDGTILNNTMRGDEICRVIGEHIK